MSFTDGVRHVATEDDVERWQKTAKSVGTNRFRCGLCGHNFVLGDGFRFVYGAGRCFEIEGKRYGVRNFLTCDGCDGPDVLDRWVARNEDFYGPRFWALRS